MIIKSLLHKKKNTKDGCVDQLLTLVNRWLFGQLWPKSTQPHKSQSYFKIQSWSWSCYLSMMLQIQVRWLGSMLWSAVVTICLHGLQGRPSPFSSCLQGLASTVTKQCRSLRCFAISQTKMSPYLLTTISRKSKSKQNQWVDLQPNSIGISLTGSHPTCHGILQNFATLEQE
jgi:hypothetical protein